MTEKEKNIKNTLSNTSSIVDDLDYEFWLANFVGQSDTYAKIINFSDTLDKLRRELDELNTEGLEDE